MISYRFGWYPEHLALKVRHSSPQTGNAGTSRGVPNLEGFFMAVRSVHHLDHMRAGKVPHAKTVGVYALFMGDQLRYIGQSTDVWYRVASHTKSSAHEFDSVFVHECEADELSSLESLYINHYLPPGNVKVPGRTDSMMGKRARKKYGIVLGY